MRRADRLFQIIQVLRRTRKPLTADAIAAELETSKRTIYRDIATLIGQRVPIRGEAGMGYILEKGFDLPPLMLTPDEIEAAVLGAQWVAGHADSALARAAGYAQEREVFGRPIGQNQGIQHPLAQSWMELEAAHLMVQKAAWLYDRHQPCGAEANAAKYLAAEACYHACERAILTHGGMGYAREYHVERYMRESWIPRLAPVSPQLILCFIAEKVLGLPKSY